VKRVFYYLYSPIASAREITEEMSVCNLQRNSITASFQVILVVCISVLIYQLAVQVLLLEPFRLGNIIVEGRPNTEEVYTLSRNLAFVFTVFSAFSVACVWILTTLYLYFWATVFSSKTDFRRLLVLNAYAFTPLVLTSVLSIVLLFIAVLKPTDLFWGNNNSFFNVVLPVEDYVEYAKGIPVIGACRMLRYGSELWALCLVAINTRISQRLSTVLSASGAVIFGTIMSAVSMYMRQQ